MEGCANENAHGRLGIQNVIYFFFCISVCIDLYARDNCAFLFLWFFLISNVLAFEIKK